MLTLEADTAVSSSTEIWTAVISASCPYNVWSLLLFTLLLLPPYNQDIFFYKICDYITEHFTGIIFWTSEHQYVLNEIVSMLFNGNNHEVYCINMYMNKVLKFTIYLHDNLPHDTGSVCRTSDQLSTTVIQGQACHHI